MKINDTDEIEAQKILEEIRQEKEQDLLINKNNEI